MVKYPIKPQKLNQRTQKKAGTRPSSWFQWSIGRILGKHHRCTAGDYICGKFRLQKDTATISIGFRLLRLIWEPKLKGLGSNKHGPGSTPATSSSARQIKRCTVKLTMLVARHLLNLKPLLPSRNLKTAQTFVQSPILSFTIGQFFQLSDADPVGDNRVAALEDTTGLVKNRIFHFATH